MTVELAIAMPLLALIMLVLFHIVVVSQANSVAHAASTAALTDARRLEGSVSTATAAAQEILRDNTTLLDSPSVSVRITSTTVTVRVTGKSRSFVPGEAAVVTSEVRGPKERTTAP